MIRKPEECTPVTKEEARELLKKLEEMKNVDVRTVDKSTLVDINTVEIDTSLPPVERIVDYIRQIKTRIAISTTEWLLKSVSLVRSRWRNRFATTSAQFVADEVTTSIREWRQTDD